MWEFWVAPIKKKKCSENLYIGLITRLWLVSIALTYSYILLLY